MGKVKKSKDKSLHRHNPLDQQITEDSLAQASSRNKIRHKDQKHDKFVGEKLTNDILKQAREQQEDLEEEIGLSDSNSVPFHSLSLINETETDDDSSNLSSNRGIEKESEEINISEDDQRALEKFMGEDSQKTKNIADDIKETLTEKQTEIFTHFSDNGSVPVLGEDKAFKFKELVPILNEYRSGKLPKLFKAIPRFTNWEQILYLTEPDKWSAATMYQATRMFSSNLQDKMAQRFYNLILLPRLRDDIAESKTLNVHLYQALEKALYKPAAFFKGIIIPLCKSKNCTLREATIIGSVLAKCSIPVLHSSAALLTIAEMEYSPVNSHFIRILIEKKYALPFRVVNAVVNHFLRFMESPVSHPVLWHQCLLAFVQLYKADLSPEQKTNLLKLITVQKHEKITPEIQKELKTFPNIDDVTKHLMKM